MAGASDFSVGNAPYGASYAGPLVNFAPLSQAPDAYFKGQQQRRTLDLQNVFKDGVPQITGPDGQQVPDYNAMMQTLAKAGAERACVSMPRNNGPSIFRCLRYKQIA